MFVLFLNTWHYYHSTQGEGEILWYIFYDEELLTIFVLFRFEEGRGRDKGRAGPIPEIHLNLCANNSQRFPEGEGTHLESVTQSFPRRLRQGQDYKCGRVAYETRSCNRSSYPLAYFVTFTPMCFSFIYRQLLVISLTVYKCVEFCAESSYTKHCIHLQTHCIVLSRLSKSFSITVYTLNNWEWRTGIHPLHYC